MSQFGERERERERVINCLYAEDAKFAYEALAVYGTTLPVVLIIVYRRPLTSDCYQQGLCKS